MANERAARQGLYQCGLGAGASLNAPGPLHVAAPPAVPQADNGFAENMRGFGERFLGVLAKEYEADETARVQAAVSDAQRRFYEFKTAYMENNRGQDAGNALADFAGAYEKISRETLENFGGHANERFIGELNKELRSKALLAARDGGTYQAKEMRAFRDSVWKGMLAEHEDLIATNPLDGEAAEFSGQRLAETWQKLNPGMDARAALLDIAGKTNESRLKALLAAGEGGDDIALAAAEKLLDGGGLSLPDPSRYGLAMVPAKHKYALSPEIDAKCRAAARKHGVPEHIVCGVIMQESGGQANLVSKAGAVGIAQFMPATAKKYGVNSRDVDSSIDGCARYLADLYKDKQDWTLAVTSYNAAPGNVSRWRAGKRQLARESLEYASRVFNHAAQAGGFGLSGQQVAGARAKIQHIRETRAREAAARAEADTVDGWLNEWRDQPLSRQMSNLMEAVAAIPDREQGARLLRMAQEQIKFEDNRKKLAAQAEAEEYYTKLQEAGGGIMDMNLQLANEQNISPEARQIVAGLIQPASSKVTDENNEALYQGKLLVEADDPQMQTRAARLMYAKDHRLTPGQTKDLLDWKPKGDAIATHEIDTVAKQMGVEDSYRNDALAAYVRRGLRGNLNPNKRDIEKLVAEARIKGIREDKQGWFGHETGTMADAYAEGKLDDWLPDVEADERKPLDELLQKMGIRATGKNRALLKKLNILPEWLQPDQNAISWEK